MTEFKFWDLGHKLFRTTPETYPAKFLAGDMFDDAHLSPTTPTPSGPPPPVGSVNSLTELRGHVSAITTSSFFHLFGEEKQFEVCKRLAALLDPRPGSIIWRDCLILGPAPSFLAYTVPCLSRVKVQKPSRKCSAIPQSLEHRCGKSRFLRRAR